MTGVQQEVILENIRKDRSDIEGDLKVIRLEFFTEPYPLTPEDIGSIEVEYDKAGHRAIYGFRADGKVSIYMD